MEPKKKNNQTTKQEMYPEDSDLFRSENTDRNQWPANAWKISMANCRECKQCEAEANCGKLKIS